MDLSWVTVPTPLPSGPMRFGVTARGVASASYTGSYPGAAGPECTDPRRVELVRARVGEYFAGVRRELELPIDWSLAGGPHLVVLRCLLATVGWGRTVTYGELAARSGVFTDPSEPGVPARTVGQMMGANPLPLLVPCHRVVAADGLGGFGGAWHGVETKRWLLTLEGVLPPTLDWSGPTEAG
ncbi:MULTISPECIES: methylated-DNA--[protein]-cysteine S-methyltransferase [Kitasatospora]|uniref:Methylated-DNA--protein-cysteine methyltransferase n=1 Tax=Kitasatospora setae (strain ATCC 33774 / DSM 43861 / JCM 3304 / KCC A-0304 / NBRC 14216 / KM-6054) TaxID=452652 RepID=E4NDG1_KITSK|nr:MULTISPECIES: methylated-DNA--[protein]-cysteine S-methyltransferase [Kitasatospora]BAJ29242.1 putative methylated-DNA--protein-cysteine methyltransferase [Kitasatospora setae KM-6054]